MEVTNEVFMQYDKLIHFIINKECHALAKIYGHDELYSVGALRVVEKLQRLETIDESTSRILSKVIRNAIIDFHRANRKHTQTTNFDNIQVSYHDKVMTLKETYHRTVEPLLTREQREVFNMYLSGYKQREIALELECSQQKISKIVNIVKNLCKTA